MDGFVLVVCFRIVRELLVVCCLFGLLFWLFVGGLGFVVSCFVWLFGLFTLRLLWFVVGLCLIACDAGVG